MVDTIIPGISDERAREILASLADPNGSACISLTEMEAMMNADLWSVGIGYPRMEACRALWERIKAE